MNFSFKLKKTANAFWIIAIMAMIAGCSQYSVSGIYSPRRPNASYIAQPVSLSCCDRELAARINSLSVGHDTIEIAIRVSGKYTTRWDSDNLSPLASPWNFSINFEDVSGVDIDGICLLDVDTVSVDNGGSMTYNGTRQVTTGYSTYQNSDGYSSVVQNVETRPYSEQHSIEEFSYIVTCETRSAIRPSKVHFEMDGKATYEFNWILMP